MRLVYYFHPHITDEKNQGTSRELNQFAKGCTADRHWNKDLNQSSAELIKISLFNPLLSGWHEWVGKVVAFIPHRSNC